MLEETVEYENYESEMTKGKNIYRDIKPSEYYIDGKPAGYLLSLRF